MEKILAENVKKICKKQNKQLKDLAAHMGYLQPVISQ